MADMHPIERIVIHQGILVPSQHTDVQYIVGVYIPEDGTMFLCGTVDRNTLTWNRNAQYQFAIVGILCHGPMPNIPMNDLFVRVSVNGKVIKAHYLLNGMSGKEWKVPKKVSVESFDVGRMFCTFMVPVFVDCRFVVDIGMSLDDIFEVFHHPFELG